MHKTIKITKGFDINLVGKAAKTLSTTVQPDTFAISPDDFVSFGLPKVLVKVGDSVKAGTPLMFDKSNETAMICSPVSGEIVEVNRGEKRKLIDIKILADKSIEYENYHRFTLSEVASLKREEAQEVMCKGGVWPQIIQRPFGTIANPSDSPKSIFISAFDSHPLAPDYNFIFEGNERNFETGIEILKKFTKGTIHVNVNGDAEFSKVFNVKNAQINKFVGKHPVGNVGIQIHHLDPIRKGDIVWTLNPYGVIQIGKLFLEGVYDASKIIALVGSEVKTPQYYKTFIGAHLSKFLQNNLKSDHVRVISGNVLTGVGKDANGYLGFYDHQVTVIPEGDKPRFFLTDGWLGFSSRISFHRAWGLLSSLSPKKERVIDTNTNGEERAFVMSGAFEKVVPMDLLPTHLIKAILAKDIEDMEALGIYEVVEEDLALCEFIDVSKHPIQEIVREGIDLVREA
jgi:Na+-transporting NADH:ubiquinone oxidoreductase subunit A